MADSGKPPALLVHGTSFVGEVWDEVANALTSRYTVYAIDRRGRGASPKPPRTEAPAFALQALNTLEAETGCPGQLSPQPRSTSRPP